MLFRSRDNSHLFTGVACQPCWMKIEPGCERRHPGGLREPDPESAWTLTSYTPKVSGRGAPVASDPRLNTTPSPGCTGHTVKLSCFGTSRITHHFCVQKYLLGACDVQSSLPDPGATVLQETDQDASSPEAHFLARSRPFLARSRPFPEISL